MRCDDFDKVVCELARDGLVDAAVRAKALSHLSSCDRCASRLAGERYLNEALSIAAAAETECAPLSVRLALLQAFTGRGERSPAGPSPAAKRLTSSWYAAAVAAAVLVAVVSVLSVRMNIRRHPAHAPQPAPDEQASLRASTQPPTGPVGPDLLHSGSNLVSGVRGGLRRGLLHSRQALDDLSHPAGFDGPASEAEALSDFIPLTHLSSATAIESGQVIRVKVPLSAFLAFGLPVSPEHADQLVNAEVVVGDDGVKRAVRLVR